MKSPKPADLPKRLKSKVILADKARDPANTCWIWTGAFTPPRNRAKQYTPHTENARESDTSGCRVNERGVPNVWLREKGHPVPAYRAVHAALADIPYTQVPKLDRCTNDRCVSPYCNTPALRQPASPSAMAVLQRDRPMIDLGPESAAEECGLAPITADEWHAYVLWDRANPEPE